MEQELNESLAQVVKENTFDPADYYSFKEFKNASGYTNSRASAEWMDFINNRDRCVEV